jgi:hypothetical protein
MEEYGNSLKVLGLSGQSRLGAKRRNGVDKIYNK